MPTVQVSNKGQVVDNSTTTTTDKVQIGDSTTGTSTSTSYTIGSRPQAERGWECPRCGRINAPWKSQCDCSSGYPYYEDWWKQITCSPDTFRVHPETTTWKAPSSICKTDSATSAKVSPSDTITTWVTANTTGDFANSSMTYIDSPWNQYSTLTNQLDKLKYEIEELKETK